MEARGPLEATLGQGKRNVTGNESRQKSESWVMTSEELRDKRWEGAPRGPVQETKLQTPRDASFSTRKSPTLAPTSPSTLAPLLAMMPFLPCSRFRWMKRGQPKENSAPRAWLIKSPAAGCSSAHTLPITAHRTWPGWGPETGPGSQLRNEDAGEVLGLWDHSTGDGARWRSPCVRIRGHYMSVCDPGQATYLLAPRWAPCSQLSTDNDHHMPTNLISTTFSVISTYLKHFMISTFLKPDCSLTIIKSIFQLIGGSIVSFLEVH